MRGGMPAPAYAQVEPTIGVLPGTVSSSPAFLVLTAPARRSRRLLALLILAGTVSLTGAATGYTASHRRLVPRAQPLQVLRQVPQPKQTAIALAREQPSIDPAERLPVLVQRRMPISVAVDGEVRRLSTAAKTPREVLAEAGVRLGPGDRVFPSPRTQLWSGATVRVVRIDRSIAARRVALAPPTTMVTKTDPMLPRGMVRTDPGVAGVKVQRFLNVLADGRLVSMTYLGQEVVRPSTASVTRVGSKILVASRGQFAGKEFMDMVATAYSPYCCKGVDSATAIGMRAGYGVVAVDPRVIPLRSRLYIDGYGYAIAGDTGGRIKGLRIDLGMDTLRAAKQFGRRPVRVYIIEKGKPKKKKTS